MANQSLWFYFSHAGLVVKLVMLILLAASVVSWTFIFQRWRIIKNMKRAVQNFETAFWSGADLSQLFSEIEKNSDSKGLSSIFRAGFQEFLKLTQQSTLKPEVLMEGLQRAMRIVESKEMDNLENHLPFLATVGSTSPYIGLFGTVWGIMTAFQSLGTVQSATIAMVAPGISEALIATAMGLFAAIPAVIAYNRFASQVERIGNQFQIFQEEFANILYRQAHSQ